MSVDAGGYRTRRRELMLSSFLSGGLLRSKTSNRVLQRGETLRWQVSCCKRSSSINIIRRRTRSQANEVEKVIFFQRLRGCACWYEVVSTEVYQVGRGSLQRCVHIVSVHCHFYGMYRFRREARNWNVRNFRRYQRDVECYATSITVIADPIFAMAIRCFFCVLARRIDKSPGNLEMDQSTG